MTGAFPRQAFTSSAVRLGPAPRQTIVELGNRRGTLVTSASSCGRGFTSGTNRGRLALVLVILHEVRELDAVGAFGRQQIVEGRRQALHHELIARLKFQPHGGGLVDSNAHGYLAQTARASPMPARARVSPTNYAWFAVYFTGCVPASSRSLSIRAKATKATW